MAFKLTAKDLFKTTFKTVLKVFKYFKKETAKDLFKKDFLSIFKYL